MHEPRIETSIRSFVRPQENSGEEHRLEASNSVLGEIEAPGKPQLGGPRSIQDGWRYAVYGLALGVSFSLWFIAIRAPLWLDETVSFFFIKGGWREIMSRQGWPAVPVYSYILWLWAKAVGTGEVTLRMSSILAMLVAAYLLYRSARQLFDKDVAMIAVVVFCLHPIVVFASIDVRPYAFGAVAITSCILALAHLRHNDSNWLAALFGFSAAFVVYFQVLFVVLLPALALCFIALKAGNRKVLWRQGGIALAIFALAFLPVIPGLLYMFHSSGTHVFTPSPQLAELRSTLAMGKWPGLVLATIVLVSAVAGRFDLRSHREGWAILFCTSLALIPVLILYGVSVGTPIHIFVARYRLVAVPGIALCWALVVSRIDSRSLRLLFCVAVVAASAYHDFTFPYSKLHGYSWKYALAAVEQNASTDNAVVLMCSDLPESDSMPIPTGSAIKDSALFAPLTYYQLSVPVVGLPRSLNSKAVRVGSRFLQEAAQRHERFLAMAFFPSYETLEWMADNADGTHSVRELGIFDGIEVLEFVPHAEPGGSR